MSDAVGKSKPNKRTNVAEELLESLREGAEILAGKRPPSRVWYPPAPVDVRAIRRATGLSQTNFARRFGFTVGAIRDWEQERRQPEAAARILLMIIARRPEVVDEALAASAPRAA